jgi:hypothetical protein
MTYQFSQIPAQTAGRDMGSQLTLEITQSTAIGIYLSSKHKVTPYRLKT